MSEQFSDQEFVEFIVKNIVDNPNDVVVERIVDERGVLLTLKVNPEDMGYVIGRQGQSARALRTLLRIVGVRNNARVNLKIFEPEGSNRGRRHDNDHQDDHSHDDEDTSAVDDLQI